LKLTNNAIALREYRIEDADAMLAWISDPEAIRNLTWDVGDLFQAQQFIEKTIAQSQEKPRSIYELAIVELPSKSVVGSAGLRIQDWRHRRADLGYILRRDRWGRGYMTEAVKLLLKLGFTLGIHRIEATCRPENLASARVLQKSGLQLEGRMRHVQFVRGEWWDALMFAVISDSNVLRDASSIIIEEPMPAQ
jgi:[ribosomal protein S5]-alanine N-acetyltransferase